MSALTLLGVITMSATPALAATATPASTSHNCQGSNPPAFTVTGAVGDTFTLIDTAPPTCYVGINGAWVVLAQGASANLGNVVTATYSSTNPSTYSFVILGAGTFMWTNSPSRPANVTVVVIPSSGSTESGIAPIPQAVGLPASGSCTDVKDAELSWGTGLTGGWAKAWEPWVNSGNGGWACRRVLAYNGSAWGLTH